MKRSAMAGPAILLVVLTSASSSSAQTGEIRAVPLVVMNQSGRIIQGITPQNVRIKGRKASVQSVALDTAPRDFIPLLDVSGSMRDPAGYPRREKWFYANEMIKAFLSVTPRRDFIALDAFAKNEVQILPSAHNFASIRSALDGPPEPDSKAARSAYGEKTAAGEALFDILQNVGRQAGSDNTAVFFSDGQLGFPDASGRRTLDSLVANVERHGVRVFLARIPNAYRWESGLPEDLVGQMLQDASGFMETTGGSSFIPAKFPDPWPSLPACWLSSFQKRIAALSNAIHGTHRLELQFAEPIRKKQKLLLETLDDKGKNMRNVNALYAHAVYPTGDSVRPVAHR